MTPNERAIKFVEKYGVLINDNFGKTKDLIAAEIQAAVEDSHKNSSYIQGKKYGLEDAAKIAEEEIKDQMWSPNAHRCAIRIMGLIRARAKEMK